MRQTDLTCGRLMLRPWSPGDEDAVLAACQDADIQRWTSVPSPYLRGHAHLWVTETATELWETGEAATWGIFDATTAALLGSIGLHGISGGVAMVGYWCVAEARGRGVTSEALAAVCRWGFGALELERINWVAFVGNEASRAVALTCGFTIADQTRLHPHREAEVEAWEGWLLSSDEIRDRRAAAGPNG